MTWQNPETKPFRVSKKDKYSHASASALSTFWDNLSKVDLTKRALKELNRRNAGTLDSRQAHPRSRRPITRHFLAHLERSKFLTPVASYLDCCCARTLKKLKQTARHGGPDLSDLRGMRPRSYMMRSTESSSPPSSCPNPCRDTPATRSTGPYNRNFQQHLIDYGVYPDGYEYADGRVLPQPDNWEEIQHRLSQRRPSLSPSRFSDEDFRRFKRLNKHASKETQVTTWVIPMIEGDARDARCVSGDVPFANLDHLTDGTLAPAKPDIYYGAQPEQIDRQIREELSGHIIPSTQDDLPILPNFFLEVKGPDGSLAVAGRQACYHGALGARGMHSLLSYDEEATTFDTKASTITCVYHGGALRMSTSHLSQHDDPERQREYALHELDIWGMTGNIEGFRKGATAYRNARDWAKEQRDQAIKRANEKAGRKCPTE